MTDTAAISLGIVAVLSLVLAVLRLRHLSMQSLVLDVIGTIVGLLLGALVSVPLSHLPGLAGSILPLTVSVAITIITIGITIGRRHQLLAMLPWLRMDSSAPASPAASGGSMPRILVDTSAIIDGRIADIAAAGFVPGRLVVPRFVLAELQNIADSEDAMRRGRGRRGLEVLGRLRDEPGVGIEVIDDDVAGIKEVDAKLVSLAQRFKCNVLTTDYNLNQVAGIQGVRVLNVNELSNAIRPVVLPGEELRVRVVQPGKERNQGVGYLADGTMIVVENGDKLMGQEVSTEVTRVFQTVAGKMIFATPKMKPGHGAHSAVAAAAERAKPAEPPAGITPTAMHNAEDTLLEAIAAQQTDGATPGVVQPATGANHRHRGRGRGHRGNHPAKPAA